MEGGGRGRGVGRPARRDDVIRARSMAAGKAQRYEAFVSDVLRRDLRSVTSSTRDPPATLR